MHVCINVLASNNSIYTIYRSSATHPKPTPPPLPSKTSRNAPSTIASAVVVTAGSVKPLFSILNTKNKKRERTVEYARTLQLCEDGARRVQGEGIEPEHTEQTAGETR